MSTDRDDDALSWGDDDPTLDSGTAAVRAGDTPRESGVAASGAAPSPSTQPPVVDVPTADLDEASPTLSNTALVSFGVLGGIYLLFTVGWIVGGLRLQGYASYLVADVMFQGSFWLAVCAPALWFATSLVLTRGRPRWVSFVALVAGMVLLMPWPFAMLGVSA
ncbi:hypothetical protein GCM10009808_05020 [Microbacterium sediminicola]|uniref:DNA polymerase III subunit gamma/tau n=1 Tax=Microbacterium sediminicola TaxID=415210 RepID=A0ABP4TNZ0_9MICO